MSHNPLAMHIHPVVFKTDYTTLKVIAKCLQLTTRTAKLVRWLQLQMMTSSLSVLVLLVQPR